MNAKLTNDNLHLRWDDHLVNIANLFKSLYNDNSLVDVTLSCRDGDIKAHKLVLSACSPYFQRVFKDNPHPHPVVIMHGVRHCEMSRLVEFIYKGTIVVPAQLLVNLMHIANGLEIKGFERFSNDHDGDDDAGHTSSITVETVKVSQNSTAKKPNENDGVDTPPQVGRDTRYNGRKRVAVDYSDEENSKENKLERKTNSCRTVTEKTADEHNNTVTAEKSVTVIRSKKRNEADDQKTKPPENSEQVNAEEEIDLTTISDTYTCSICSSSFKSKDELIEHFKYHNQKQEKSEKTYNCKMHPSFKKPLHVTKYKTTQLEERSFYCELCGQEFSKLNKLQNHLRLTHELLTLSKSNNRNQAETDVNVQLKKEKRETCNTYEAAFLQELQLQQVNEKRGRGRPRKYPMSSFLPKRAKGRPKGSTSVCNESGLLYNELMYNDGNFDVTTLPYGDLNYLTMPEKNATVVDTPKVTEVQMIQKKKALIKVEKAPPQQVSVTTDTPVFTEVTTVANTENAHASNDQLSELPIIIEPYVEITSEDTDMIDPSNASRFLNPFYTDPSLQAIGQIGVDSDRGCLNVSAGHYEESITVENIT